MDTSNPDPLLVNTWYHLVITRNSQNQQKYYIDTVAQTGANEYEEDFKIRYIGQDGNSNFYKGWLDEFRLYSKELIQAEIEKNYNKSKAQHSN